MLLSISCASAPSRPSHEVEELKELRSQLGAQSALIAQQDRRIEELEVKLAALSAKAAEEKAPAKTAPSAVEKAEPRPQLKTIKVGGRAKRSVRANPVEKAPALPDSVALQEPDDRALQRLQVDPALLRAFDADHAWATAVQKLNSGKHEEAERDLLAFADTHPQHEAADNALYLAGLIREARGDCASALQLFEQVPERYPAGDAVPQALLERGRCLRTLGKTDEAKAIFNQLSKEHPDAPEATQARQLLHQ
jgi:tol-pal system protein YbgF